MRNLGSAATTPLTDVGCRTAAILCPRDSDRVFLSAARRWKETQIKLWRVWCHANTAIRTTWVGLALCIAVRGARVTFITSSFDSTRSF